MQIRFRDSFVSVKDFDCQLGTLAGAKLPPFVNMFVKVTKGCNAHCRFCSNDGKCASKNPFNVEKLIGIIDELQESGVRVNKLNITGGEPSVVPDLVEEIIGKINDRYSRSIHLHLNTNGLLPESKKLMCDSRWDSISLSLHHYDISKLSELYGCRIPDSAFNFEGINVQILNASCNLIKGYIDSAPEASRMLDFALELGLTRLGFVALMKVNDYCCEHFVDLEDIHLDTIPHVYFTKSMSRGSDCKCSNYLYNNNLRVLEVYMRNYSNPYYCESSLVYDGEFLRQGFHKNNIIC